MKTSIEKSHSVWSNTKLTILSIITIMMVSLFTFSFITYKYLEKNFFLLLIIVSGFISFICLVLFNKFKR